MTFPLATLGPTITPQGITIPTYSDIYSSLQASFQGIYGADAVISPDSQDGQMLAIYARGYADCNNAIVALYASFSPSFAQGVMLSTLVRINGLQRNVATNSTVLVHVLGSSGATVINGVFSDPAGNLWNLPASLVITGGDVTAIATAQNVGNISLAGSSALTIYNPQLGWTGVTNTSTPATPGAPIEGDASLRVRQAGSVEMPASSPLGAIYAAIGALPGVQQWTVYENDSAITDINGVPSHTIVVIESGATSLTQVAQTIQQTKSQGTGTYGTTTIVVTDATSGLPISISFDVLTQTAIYVSLAITGIAAAIAPDSATTQAIQNAVAAYINGLPIGEDVYVSQLYPPAQLDNVGLGAGYYITALTLGTAPSPVGTTNIPIAFNAAAYCAPGNVVITPS